VAITPEENVAYLEAVLAKAKLGAAATAAAMAAYVAERVKGETLTRNMHSPGAYYKARPGAPPSSASGRLAKGMYSTPASGGLRATAIAGNDAEHAKLLEFGGCVLRPTGGKVMHWTDSGGSWFHAVLPGKEHPFLGPTTEDAVDDGELRRVAIDAFREYDP
jgi:hypothetical protein